MEVRVGDKAQRIESVCRAVRAGRLDFARQVITRTYPWDPRAPLDALPVAADPRGFRPAGSAGRAPKTRRVLDRRAELRIFVRDGFRDRYSGKRLVFPGTLLVLAVVLHDVVPYPDPPSARRERTHQMMCELYPVVDHVIPLSRPERLRAAGLADPDDPANLVTTSTANNTAKGIALPAEVGWTCLDLPAGEAWDGLSGWFREYLGHDAAPLADSTHGRAIAAWRDALDAAA